LKADPQTPNWKQAFFGENYEALHAIKLKYDPDHVFYASQMVGSDDWQVAANGALCRTREG